jgi:hypothetical protein
MLPEKKEKEIRLLSEQINVPHIIAIITYFRAV